MVELGWEAAEPVGGKWECGRTIAFREDGDELEEEKDRFSGSGNSERTVGEGAAPVETWSPVRPFGLGGGQKEKAALVT